MSNRMNIDFSKHELTVTKTDQVTIHHLKRPDTIIYNCKFINTNGVLLVTGDFGNWVFCREFHPSKGGKVSSGYWAEKLHINSEQEGMKFDSESTIKEINQGIKGGLEEYGYEDNELEEMQEYYNNLLDYAECSEWEYTSYAYMEKPSFLDAESVPFVKDIKPNLKAVFDSFEEICKRLN